jgi:hypothetical protein
MLGSGIVKKDLYMTEFGGIFSTYLYQDEERRRIDSRMESRRPKIKDR